MRIIIATGIFPPDIGGPAVYSRLIAGEFAQLGHKVVVVSYGEKINPKSGIRNPKQIQNSKFKILKVPRTLPKGIRHFVYFCKIFWHGMRADVIYAQDPVSAGLPVCMATWILRKPFVLKVVGDYAWEQFQNQKSKIKNQKQKSKFKNLDDFQNEKFDLMTELRRKIEHSVAKHAKVIITPSNYLKSVVEKWGVKASKINVVYNAAQVPQLLSKEECRKDLWLNGTVLLSVGRLVPWKGFEMLIDLMPKILNKHPDAKLYIIGRGPEQKHLESKIKKHELGGFVFLAGSLSHESVLEYLRAADLFLLNTGYEGFSHQILEAMATGVPVITTNAGGNKEIIKDSENALLAKYNNEDEWQEKIIKLIEDKTLQKKLSENAQKEAEKYTKEKMISETLEILKI